MRWRATRKQLYCSECGEITSHVDMLVDASRAERNRVRWIAFLLGVVTAAVTGLVVNRLFSQADGGARVGVTVAAVAMATMLVEQLVLGMKGSQILRLGGYRVWRCETCGQMHGGTVLQQGDPPRPPS